MIHIFRAQESLLWLFVRCLSQKITCQHTLVNGVLTELIVIFWRCHFVLYSVTVSTHAPITSSFEERSKRGERRYYIYVFMYIFCLCHLIGFLSSRHNIILLFIYLWDERWTWERLHQWQERLKFSWTVSNVGWITILLFLNRPLT